MNDKRMLENTHEDVISKKCEIEVFGLGYIGFPLAVRLASAGFHVRGIDVNSTRISRLENNELMDTELRLKKEFLHVRNEKKLEFLKNPSKSENPKIALICVHTPIASMGKQSDVYVKDAVENFLETSKKGDIIILESSISGGTTNKMEKIIECKGYKPGKDFGLCFCPERIDPQNEKWKLENIPRVIYCSDDISFAICQEIYNSINNAQLHRVESSIIAEVVKSYENAFRLVNISLVNELAILCDKIGINVIDVINAAKTKPFGFMPFYPGAGAGGHCIPKDPLFLIEAAEKRELKFTTIENAIEVNQKIPKHICDSIELMLEQSNLKKSVLVCGLAYKADIEDMRDSPGFKIINELKSRNFKVVAYDPYFNPNLMQKYLIENHLEELEFQSLKELDIEKLSEFSCLCLVQHHSKTKFKINKIYEKSLIPMIYDCQSKMKKISKSKTIFSSFGS